MKVGGAGDKANWSASQLLFLMLPSHIFTLRDLEKLHWQSSWAWPQGSQPCISFFIFSFKIALVAVITSLGRPAWSRGAPCTCRVSTAFPTPPTVRHSLLFHFEFLGVLQHSSFLSECVPHLECTFWLCKNKQSDSSTRYQHTCGISAHNLLLLNGVHTCTEMIQSLE